MSTSAQNDFDRDGRSDVLWRDAGGAIHEWSGTSAGSFVDGWTLNWANTATIVATGDFNGDGREDLLLSGGYSSPNGTLLISALQTRTAGFQADWEGATLVPPGWHIVGAGDFNGDGKTDVLLRNDIGQITDWLIAPPDSTIVDVPDAPFMPNNAKALLDPGANWQVVGTADFNGDGRADVLLQDNSGLVTDWLSQSDGSFIGNHLGINPGTTWHVAGTGDINGDGRADVIWRNDDGTVADWLAQPDGSFVGSHIRVNPGITWHLLSIGDFNGDGRADLFWQNDNGSVTDWLAQGDGSFIGNHLNLAAPVGFHVQDPFIHDSVV